MNYIAEIKQKDGEPYVGLMNRPHCSTNCSMFDYKNQPVIYAFPITKNYEDYINKYLKNKTGNGLAILQDMNVKKSVKYLKSAISKLQGHSQYGAFSDGEEADYFKSTPKHAIIALTHLKEMAEECIDTTCIWNVKESA